MNYSTPNFLDLHYLPEFTQTHIHWEGYGHEFEQSLGDNEEQGSLGMLQFIALQRVRQKLVTEQKQQKELGEVEEGHNC